MLRTLIPLIVGATVSVQTNAQSADVASEKFDFVLSACQAVLSTGKTTTESARPTKQYKPGKDPMRRVTPVFAFFDYFGDKSEIDISMVKTTITKQPSHGKIDTYFDKSINVNTYTYESAPSYLGEDQAEFAAVFKNKKYSVLIKLFVVKTPEDYERVAPPEDTPVCPAKLKKL